VVHYHSDTFGFLLAIYLFPHTRTHTWPLQLIVATGKARGPWVPDVLPRLGTTLPGVFLQGLLIADAEGNILHSR